MSVTRGYLLIAIGESYVDEATRLVNTLRKVHDDYPVSIVCSDKDVAYVESKDVFDNVIVYDFNNTLAINDKTSFEKYGGTPKIWMIGNLPYDQTIYIDTDVLIQSNTTTVWNYMNSIDQCCVAMGIKANISDTALQNFANKISVDINDMYHIHSGIVFFNTLHKDFLNFNNIVKKLWLNYYEYGLNYSIFRDGKADEAAITAAYNILQYTATNGNVVPIMTHNYHSDIQLPSNIITGGGMWEISAITETPPPFIHMFKAYGKQHYNVLYNRLMNL